MIWLPEMTQGVVNSIARKIHMILMAHGEPLRVDRRPRSPAPELQGAYAVYRDLRACSRSMRARLGTASPRDLGEALLGMRPTAYARRGDLLGGARLLPLGRFYRDGVDVYPGLVAQLQQEQAAAGSGFNAIKGGEERS